MCDQVNPINLCECGNATYIKTLEKEIEDKESGEVIKKIVKVEYCKACGKEYDTKDNEFCILNISYDNEIIEKKNLINKYTINDPTLPKAQGIKCPNVECPNKQNKANQNIVYLTHNEANMSYTYICVDCYKNGIEPNVW